MPVCLGVLQKWIVIYVLTEQCGGSVHLLVIQRSKPGLLTEGLLQLPGL